MTVEAYLKINKEDLSTVKTNVIPYQLEKDGPECGTVKKIIGEVQEGVFKCLVVVYPEHENTVLEAMRVEAERLKG